MPISDITPTVDSVGARLRVRTKTVGGKEMGTFTSKNRPEDEQTHPSAEQVIELMEEPLSDMVAAFGANVPDAPGDPADPDYDADAYRKAVRSLVSLGTALQVELSYWPEQINTNRSPYPQLLKQYETRLARTLELIAEGAGAGSPGGGSVSNSPSGYPSGGGFPNTAIGMENPW